MDTYWTRQRIGRRSLIRGAALGGAGLAGAALIGCGGDDDDGAGSGSTATSTAAGGGTATGSATAAPAGPKRGGTLRLGYFADDGPRLSMMGGGGHGIALHWFTHGDSYVYAKTDGTTVPMLFESYEYVDVTHLSATLRPGLLFQDGTPLNGESVKEHLATMQDSERSPRFTTYRGLIAALDSVDVVSETEVILNLKSADGGFVGSLGHAPGVPISLAQVEKLGEDELSNPRMAGPYIAQDYASGAGWTSARYDGYWNIANAEPYLDAIEWKIQTSNETRAAALRANDVDVVAYSEMDQSAKDLMEDDAFTTVTFDRSPHALNINHVAPPFDDVRVRQAVAHSLDREKVLQSIFAGLGEISYGLLLPFVRGYKKSDRFQYDPAEARKLLEAAGYSDSNKPKIVYAAVGAPPPQIKLQQAALYQQMLQETGFEVEIVNVGTTVREELGESSPYVEGSDIGQRFDSFASWTLRASDEGSLGFRSKEGHDGEVQRKMNELVLAGRGEPDDAKRISISEEISDLYHENVMGVIPVCRTLGALIANDKVGGMDNPELGHPLGSSRPRFLSML